MSKRSSSKDVPIPTLVNNFKGALDNINNTQAFTNLDIYIGETYQKVKSNEKTDEEFLKLVSRKINSTKKGIFKDSSELVKILTKATTKLYKSTEVRELSEFVKNLYKVLKPSGKAEKEPETVDAGLKDYFGELQVMQTGLQEVKKVTDQLAQRNKELNLEMSQLKATLNVTKENLVRKTKKADKFKAVIDDYRHNTIKLIHTVEVELERLNKQDLTKTQEITEVRAEIRRASGEGENIYERALEKSPEMGSPGREN